MELVLNIPMLANHRDEGRRRPYEACNIDAVITGNDSARIGRTNGFHDNDRLQIRPFRKLRDGFEVCYDPDSSPYGTAMRVIEGIKEVLGGAPRQLVLDVRMKVLLDSLIGLFVIALQRQEVVAFLSSDLTCDGRLAAHGIHGHNTPFDGEQLSEFWNRGDLIRLAVMLQLAH